MSSKLYFFAALLAACTISVSSAALIDAGPGFPLLVYNSTGTTTYDSTTDLLSIDAKPVAIRFSPTLFPRFVNPTGFPASEEVTIRVLIGDTGSLIGGVPGDDLIVVGEFDEDGDGFVDFSGVLLTGEVLEFGFEDSCGPTDLFDFRFAVTGGSLAPLFADNLIAVAVASESSTFIGDFSVSFSGEAKGNLGPEPCMGSIQGCVFCLANGQITNLEDAAVTIFQNGSVVGSTKPGSNGVYSITGLEPGDYTVVVALPTGESACSETSIAVTVTCEENGAASFCICPFQECFDLRVTKQCLVLTPPGKDCDGKVVQAIFEYTGESCDQTTNNQEGKLQCSGDPNGAEPVSIIVTKDADKVSVSPGGNILLGELVTFTATGNELRADVQFDILSDSIVEQSLKIHTSCSKPLNVGDQFGSMRLVELTTTNGGTIGLPEPQEPSSSCEVLSTLASCGTGGRESKPNNLTWVYSGGGCGASDHDQPADKANCSGTIDGNAPVAVMPEKSTPFMVDPGEPFTISRDRSKKIHLTNVGGTEFNVIHTSCSQPLRVGDVFGSLTLVSLDGVGSGQEVVFLYTIENTGSQDVTGVTVVDDLLGPVPLDPDVIPAGESVTVSKTAFVEQTATNTVTVSGTSGSATCEAQDSLTITVIAPPPPPPTPFTCEKPIDVLTMIWDGTQAIRVVAYKGPVGSEVLANIDNITPGDEVTVTGFAGSPNDVFWEIFDAGTSDKIGESKFHLSCSDSEMNGPEDCGKNEGNGKNNEPNLINDWLLKGIVDKSATLDCTP